MQKSIQVQAQIHYFRGKFAEKVLKFFDCIIKLVKQLFDLLVTLAALAALAFAFATTSSAVKAWVVIDQFLALDERNDSKFRDWFVTLVVQLVDFLQDFTAGLG